MFRLRRIVKHCFRLGAYTHQDLGECFFWEAEGMPRNRGCTSLETTDGQLCGPSLLLAFCIQELRDQRGHMSRVKPGLDSAVDGDGAAIIHA